MWLIKVFPLLLPAPWMLPSIESGAIVFLLSEKQTNYARVSWKPVIK